MAPIGVVAKLLGHMRQCADHLWAPHSHQLENFDFCVTTTGTIHLFSRYCLLFDHIAHIRLNKIWISSRRDTRVVVVQETSAPSRPDPLCSKNGKKQQEILAISSIEDNHNSHA